MRISLGGAVSVTATERWLTEIRAGKAFMGGGRQGAVVGQLSFEGLFNPVGSGKIGLLYQAWVLKATAGAVDTRRDTASTGTVIDAGQNCLLGGAAAALENNEGTAAATTGFEIITYDVQAFQLVPIGGPWLAEIPEGQGFYIWSGTANEAFTARFLWVEV